MMVQSRCYDNWRTSGLHRAIVEVLLTGRSLGCVRWGQVGTKTLHQMGCGLQNREGMGCDHPEFPNSPASTKDGTDNSDRLRSTAMPDVRFQIAKRMSSQVPRCSALCHYRLSRRSMSA